MFRFQHISFDISFVIALDETLIFVAVHFSMKILETSCEHHDRKGGANVKENSYQYETVYKKKKKKKKKKKTVDAIFMQSRQRIRNILKTEILQTSHLGASKSISLWWLTCAILSFRPEITPREKKNKKRKDATQKEEKT